MLRTVFGVLGAVLVSDRDSNRGAARSGTAYWWFCSWKGSSGVMVVVVVVDVVVVLAASLSACAAAFASASAFSLKFI